VEEHVEVQTTTHLGLNGTEGSEDVTQQGCTSVRSNAVQV